MSRPERMISEADARELLAKGSWGVLSTSSPDGIPYGVPINYFYDAEENALYFHCAVTGRKLENIHANPRVSFVVALEPRLIPERFTTHYDSVMVEGQASVISDPKEMVVLLKKLCEVLAPGQPRTGTVIAKDLPEVLMVRIGIEKVSGKRNRDV